MMLTARSAPWLLTLLACLPSLAQQGSASPPNGNAPAGQTTVAEAAYTPIRSVLANNRTPIAIDVVLGDPLLLEFDAGETVSDIAVGGVSNAKQAWEIVKRGSRIFIRLTRTGEKERKVLVTTTLHSYVFYLRPHDTARNLAYVSKLMVGFEQPAGAAALGISRQSAAADDDQAAQIPRRPIFSIRNTAYTMQIVKESTDIRPRRVWDDGRFTYFLFPKNIPNPAIYRTVPGSGEEAEINWHVDGDEVVVHGIGPAWNLRLGESVIGVFNEKYRAEGISTPNGTTTAAIREPKP